MEKHNILGPRYENQWQFQEHDTSPGVPMVTSVCSEKENKVHVRGTTVRAQPSSLHMNDVGFNNL